MLFWLDSDVFLNIHHIAIAPKIRVFNLLIENLKLIKISECQDVLIYNEHPVSN